MISEKDLENIICKYPELIEEGLALVGQQVHLHEKIIDILFKDRFGQNLIVELKAGPIDRKHIGQVMDYEGSVLSEEDPTARVMLVGNRVPDNLRKSLDHHGIEWKEIRLSYLREFLKSKNDIELLKLAGEEELNNIKEHSEAKEPKKHGRMLSQLSPEEFPNFVRKVYEKVIKQISPTITISKGSAASRYTAVFLEGRRIIHMYDRIPTRIQVHIDKSYLKKHNINFDAKSISDKFIVGETTQDYPIKINKDSDLELLGRFLQSIYHKW